MRSVYVDSKEHGRGRKWFKFKLSNKVYFSVILIYFIPVMTTHYESRTVDKYKYFKVENDLIYE